MTAALRNPRDVWPSPDTLYSGGNVVRAPSTGAGPRPSLRNHTIEEGRVRRG